VHHYVLLVTKPEEHDKFNRELIGPRQSGLVTQVDPLAGFVPPSWWRGDEYASNSGIMAGATLRRRV